MVKITDLSGQDLSVSPPSTANLAVTSAVQSSSVRVECLIIENGTLPVSRLSGTLDWNDGSRPVVYTGDGTLSIDASRKLRPGSYLISVQGHNYAADDGTVVSVNFPVFISIATGALTATPIVFGPILPKDVGFPNAEQWSFDSGSDIEILASSVKMLLTTTKGERIMLPEYGTNLRLMLFEFQGPGLENMIRQEISDAITTWEPRVSLLGLDANKTGEREITVSATFVSKLNQQNFSLELPFSP
jgi:phage baseplate assembly protein W